MYTQGKKYGDEGPTPSLSKMALILFKKFAIVSPWKFVYSFIYLLHRI